MISTERQPSIELESQSELSPTEGVLVRPEAQTGADIVPLAVHVRQYIRASKAENTVRGYRSDWRDFCSWCECRSARSLPAIPETVASYIADCAEHLKAGSIHRRLNAIAEAHKAIGLESPTSAGTRTAKTAARRSRTGGCIESPLRAIVSPAHAMCVNAGSDAESEAQTRARD